MSGKSIAEKIEPLRNIRFMIKKNLSDKNVIVSDILNICGDYKFNEKIDTDKEVSFVGFYNEFDDVYGKDCVYVHLFGKHEKEREWLAKRAVNHGAIVVISDYQIEEIPCIVVNDIWKVLKDLSKFYLDRCSCKTTAIAGSIGKTTTKEMVNCVLSQRFKTFCTPNNGNVLSYLAFEIQHMPMKVEQFIQEVDESYPNNAIDCSYVLQPDTVIITNIDNSHIGTLGGEKAVEEGIVRIADYAQNNGVVIINLDDYKSTQVQFCHNTISVGIQNQQADYLATDIVSDNTSVKFTLNYDSEKTEIYLNCPGTHNVYNAMFAFAVGKLNGLSAKEIQKGLNKYHPMTVRQKTYHTLGRTLYVDCFNASARSIGVALNVLKIMKPRFGGRRIAVLGDIAEIEGFEEETYRQISNDLKNSKIDLLVTYGTDSRTINEYLENAIDSIHLSKESELISYFKKTIKFGDVVLFKASGIMHMDRVVRSVFPVTYAFSRIPYELKVMKWLIKTI